MNEIIYLSEVRLSFPHLTEPQKQINDVTGKERVSYNCELIMPQNHPGFVRFMNQCGELAVDKWKTHAQNVMQMIQNDRKTRCYGRGEEKVNKKTFQPYDGYAGNMFITAGRDMLPQMIQADGQPIDSGNTMMYQQVARKMYGGCRVNAAVKPWVQDNKHGRGIRCDLVAVQFFRDDTPFGESEIDISGMFGKVTESSTTPKPTSISVMPSAPFPNEDLSLPPFLRGV